jgi:hypothetical protein
LRERLFDSGADALQDYELLELLLGAAIPLPRAQLHCAHKNQVVNKTVLGSWQRLLITVRPPWRMNRRNNSPAVP